MACPDYEGGSVRIGILASHAGTTAESVIDACLDGQIAGSVEVVISNNADARALDFARVSGIDALHLSGRTHPDFAELDLAITQAMTVNRVGVVLLAGYLRKVGPVLLAAYRGRVLNVHPSLLPAYGGQGMYGLRVHQAVLGSGDRTTGASIHVVDAEYDQGPVIAHREIAIEEGEDAMQLESRVRVLERQLLIETLGRLSREQMTLPV